MFYLILGLLVFLGVHSIRIFADDLRTRRIAALGLPKWKAIFALLSLAGLALMVYGFGIARMTPVALWQGAKWARDAAGLLTLVAFVLIVSAYVPNSRIRGLVGHPMIIGVKIWALGHLLANGNLNDLLLFGSILAWAVMDYRSLRQRDRAAGTTRDPGSWANDIITIPVAVVAWYVFALYMHRVLIGVAPFG